MPPRSWYGLSRREEMQVRLAARRGCEHPDPEIAAGALAWAKETLQPVGNRERAETWIGRFGMGLVDLVTGGSLLGGDLGTSIADRRVARRIIRAAERARQ